MRRNGFIYLLLAVLMLTFSLVASAGAASEKGNTLVMAVASIPTAMDPNFSKGDIWNNLLWNIYDLPVTWKLVDGPDGVPVAEVEAAEDGLEGELLEYWERPDDSTYIMHVRKGVVSNYGNELTTDDFLWSAERALTLEQSSAAFIYTSGNIKDINDFKKIDDYTFEIHASNGPSPLLLRHLTTMHVATMDSTEAKKHATPEDPWAREWLEKNTPTFGPYYIESMTAGESMILTANPNYWRGQPYFQRIIVREVPEAANRLTMLISGDVHLVGSSLTPAQFEQIKDGNGEAVMIKTAANIYAQLDFLTTQKPFNNKLCRQAVAYIIPYEQIVEKVFLGRAKASHGQICPTYKDVLPEPWPYKYDPEMAKKLWDESGEDKAFTLSWSTANAEFYDIAILLQTELAKIGINVTLQPVNQTQYAEGRSKGLMQAFYVESSMASTDTGNSITGPYGDSPFNWAKWDDKEERDLALKYMSMVDSNPERQALLYESQRLANENVPGIMFAWKDWIVGANKDLKGFAWFPLNYTKLRMLEWK